MKSKIKYLVLFLTLFISFTSFNKVNALELNKYEVNKSLLLLETDIKKPGVSNNNDGPVAETDSGTGSAAPSYCDDTRYIWYIFGVIIRIIYILTPVLLIVTGSISMLKAMTVKDETKIKDAQKGLINKVIAAVIIFLIVPLVSMVINLVADDSWKTCAKCAFNPTDFCKIPTVPTG